MTDRPDLPWDGGCRCGRVRLRVSALPLLEAACHCTGCQRMTGGPFSLSLTLPAAGFEITAGTPVIGGLRGAEIRHHHCGDCLSWLFTRVAGMDSVVNLRATMLDAAGWVSPWIESWTAEKLPWAGTPAVHSFAGFPPFERYPELVAAYRAARGFGPA